MEKSLIVTHYIIRTNQGPGVPTLFHYLRSKSSLTCYIEIPFPGATDNKTHLTIYKNGKKHLGKSYINPAVPSPLLWIYQIFVTWYLVLRYFPTAQISIGGDTLSQISLVPIFSFRNKTKSIYYSVDYAFKRFNNNWLNYLFHFLDRICCKYSTQTWVVSQNQINERIKWPILSLPNRFQIVPIAYDLNDFKPRRMLKSTSNLIYVGGITHLHGLKLAIEAMPDLVKRHSKVKLTIIGTGPEEDNIKKMIKELKITEYVKFLGYIKDHYQIVKILRMGGIGLAPYLPQKGSLSYNADPGKIKLYLSAGLPVITTNVSPMTKILKRREGGIVIDYNKDALVEAVDKIIQSSKSYVQFQKNAYLLSEEYDSNKILDTAFSSL